MPLDADWRDWPLRDELLSEECSDWLLREDGREGEELSEDCREGLLSDECREAELSELEKEWLLSEDWMLGLLSDDCREGLLSVLCRDAKRPGKKKKTQTKQNPVNTNRFTASNQDEPSLEKETKHKEAGLMLRNRKQKKGLQV